MKKSVANDLNNPLPKVIMEGKCEGCSGLGVVYECFCIDPHVLLCSHCVDSHLDREGSHRIKKIKVEKKDPSANQGNAVLCSMCKCAESLVFCCCVYPVVELCERCQDLHISKGSAYIHPIYPISEKGKVNDLEVCEKVKVKAMNRLLAIDRINQNFHYIDSCQEAINSYFEALSQSLEELKASKLTALQGMRDLLKKELEQAMKETITLNLDFHPTLPLSLLIWNFQVSSSPSDFTLFTYQLPPSTGDLLRTLEHSVSFQLRSEQDSISPVVDVSEQVISQSIAHANADEPLIEEIKAALFKVAVTAKVLSPDEGMDKLQSFFSSFCTNRKSDLLISFLYDEHCALKLLTESKRQITQSISSFPIQKQCEALKQYQSEYADDQQCSDTFLHAGYIKAELKQWLKLQIDHYTEVLALQHTIEAVRCEPSTARLQQEVTDLKSQYKTLEKTNKSLRKDNEKLQTQIKHMTSQLLTCEPVPLVQNTYNTLMQDFERLLIHPTELFFRCGYTSVPKTPVASHTKFFGWLENEAISLIDLEEKSRKMITLTRKVHYDEASSYCSLGTDSFCSCGGKDSKKVYSIQLLTGKVTRLSNMEEPRGFCGVVSCNGGLYVFGGLANSTTALASAECYSLTTYNWRSLPPMSTPRAAFTPCQYHEIVVLVGGTALEYTIELYSTINGTYIPTPLFVIGMHIPVCVRNETVILTLGTRLYQWSPKEEMRFRVLEVKTQEQLNYTRFSVVFGDTLMLFSPGERNLYEIKLDQGTCVTKLLG